MDTDRFFLISDASLRGVIDRLSPADLERPAPSDWSGRTDEPTLRDILWAHAYDEAWLPDVIAGKSVADGDPWKDRDLLGDQPIASYDALNDTATAAVEAGVDPGSIFRFQYGDYPASEGLVHLAIYRAFQAYSIAKLVGQDHHLPDEFLDGFDEHIAAHVDEWRGFGVFPPAIEPPEGADRETRILCAVGFWQP